MLIYAPASDHSVSCRGRFDLPRFEFRGAIKFAGCDGLVQRAACVVVKSFTCRRRDVYKRQIWGQYYDMFANNHGSSLTPDGFKNWTEPVSNEALDAAEYLPP